MTVLVQFWSYFATLAGTREITVEVPVGSTVSDLLDALHRLHPTLQPLRSSTLVAIHLDYASPSDLLPEGAVVSLFPPVQGG